MQSPTSAPIPDVANARLSHVTKPEALGWESIRTRVEELSLEQNLTLHDVRKSILEERGFDARQATVHLIHLITALTPFSIDSYKRQLGRWNISKTLKANQKEAIAMKLLLDNDQSSSSSVQYEGKQIDLKRIRRHTGKTGRTERSLLSQRYRSLLASSSSIADQPLPVLLLHAHDRNLKFVENCLSRMIHDWNMGQISNERSGIPRCAGFTIYGSEIDYKFFDLFLNGIRLTSKSGSQIGWTHFSAGCRMVRQLLQERPLTVLLQFIEFYVEDRWDGWTHLRHSLASYFAAMAAETLGEEHPLCILLRHCVTTGALKPTLMQTLRIIADRCASCPVVDSRGYVSRQAEIAWKYIDIGCYDEAADISAKVLENPAAPPVIVVSAMRSLSRFEEHIGDLEGSIRTSNDALRICQRHPAHFLIPEETIRITKDLGYLLFRRGAYEASCSYYWKAFDAATRHTAFRSSEVLVFFLELKKALERSNNLQAISRLQNEYSSIFEGDVDQA